MEELPILFHHAFFALLSTQYGMINDRDEFIIYLDMIYQLLRHYNVSFPNDASS